MNVPQIAYQSNRVVMYRTPSKSHPGEYHKTEFGPGYRKCTCPGVEWFRKKGIDDLKMCRHQRMCTIEYLDSMLGTFEQCLHNALLIIKTKRHDMTVAWTEMRFCTMHKHYDDYRMECVGCPLHDAGICNIHRIRLKDKRNRTPLIWQLQTAIYRGKRQEARLILNKMKTTWRKYNEGLHGIGEGHGESAGSGQEEHPAGHPGGATEQGGLPEPGGLSVH